MANHKKYLDDEVYRLSDSGLSLQEVADILAARYSTPIPLSTVSMVVGHGRKFGLCKPLTDKQKRERSSKSRLRFLKGYYAAKAKA